MELDIEVLRKLSKKSIKSKVQFRGDFQKLIDDVILMLESKIASEIGKIYQVKYITVGTNSIKLKIIDESQKLEKLIECILHYTHAEVQYGYVIVDIIAHEYSKRQKSNILGKFDITKKDILVQTIIKNFIEVIEEI